MKKRTLTLIMAALLAVALAGCGSSSSSSEPTQAENTASADLGDSYVTISGAYLTKDYEGKDAIGVKYVWTNNSDDTTSATVAVLVNAFQDGVQMDTTIISGGDDNDWKDVRPGTAIECTSYFLLTSQSPVEVEISDWTDWSDNAPMATQTFDPATLG